jgi:alkyl-hydroperoxide reductase/thiol specific antioxidant family protein
VQLHRDRERFRAAGVELVVIGQGRPEQAEHFRRSQGVEELELLVDKGRESYKAAGTKIATFNELLGPRVVLKGLRRSATSRVHQGRTVGHPAQLGGVLLVMPDGSIPYAHLPRMPATTPRTTRSWPRSSGRFAVDEHPAGAILDIRDAGWSSQVARRAHNPKVAGSNPAPATG